MQQNAEKAKFDVLRNEWEQKAMILRAEGEAEAALLISEAISKFGPGLVAMRKIEAAQVIAKELANSSNVTFLGSNTVNMLQIH
jgi:prohibitin 1